MRLVLGSYGKKEKKFMCGKEKFVENLVACEGKMRGNIFDCFANAENPVILVCVCVCVCVCVYVCVCVCVCILLLWLCWVTYVISVYVNPTLMYASVYVLIMLMCVCTYMLECVYICILFL